MKYDAKKICAIVLTIVAAPVTAFADSGLYVGAGLGSAHLADDFGGFAVDTDSMASRLSIGWQFNDYLAIEGGYHNFGKFDQTFDVSGTPTTVSLKSDGFNIGGILSLPVTSDISVFGRAGAFYWDGDALINDVTLARPEDSNPYYGGGAGVKLSQRFTLTGDWTRFELEDTNSDVISLGFTYRF